MNRLRKGVRDDYFTIRPEIFRNSQSVNVAYTYNSLADRDSDVLYFCVNHIAVHLFS